MAAIKLLTEHSIDFSKDRHCQLTPLGLQLYGFLTSVRSRWLDIGQFFFCVFMDRDGVEVYKLARIGTRPISSHLDRTSLVNKGLGAIHSTKISGNFGLKLQASQTHDSRNGSNINDLCTRIEWDCAVLCYTLGHCMEFKITKDKIAQWNKMLLFWNEIK